MTPKDYQDGVYLAAYLAPFRRWLDEPEVTEVMVNQTGDVWIETTGQTHMQRVDAPEVTADLLARLASQVARYAHQGINRESPLLAATLPDGSRIQIIGPPATRRGWALAIRRHGLVSRPLEAFATGPLKPPPLRDLQQEQDEARADPIAFLRRGVIERRTILISGGTSSGKTTFLNALLEAVPASERIVVVEDTPEIVVTQPNAVGLVAVKGALGEARVTVNELLQASLRMRPDRLIVGEIRGEEAVTFLRAINTGHPGSFTTIHANSPQGALDQLALMVLQSGLGLNRQEIIDYSSRLIDIVVQVSRLDGTRGIEDIWLP
ncbi:MAG: P-type DNA transfer ATPase VirB11 [Asticcacaulis sp.]